jgi:hypothetical protein
MDEPVFVRPARLGLKVPLPELPGHYLVDDGALVPPTSYWRRRLGDGDVVITVRPEPDKQPGKGR